MSSQFFNAAIWWQFLEIFQKIDLVRKIPYAYQYFNLNSPYGNTDDKL